MNNKIYNNLSVDNLMKTEWFNQFDGLQQIEIETGIRNNVDVFKYAKKEFNWRQMGEIRLGLEQGLDVSIYAKNYFTWIEMFDIRLCLKANQINVLICFAKIMDYFDKIQEKIIQKRKLKKREKLENEQNI